MLKIDTNGYTYIINEELTKEDGYAEEQINKILDILEKKRCNKWLLACISRKVSRSNLLRNIIFYFWNRIYDRYG